LITFILIFRNVWWTRCVLLLLAVYGTVRTETHGRLTITHHTLVTLTLVSGNPYEAEVFHFA
jgi:hypothetical protein